MRVLVVGAGAVGGLFGARMAAAGRDVTFLVRPGRAAALKQGGLRVTGALGDLSVAPGVITADQVETPFDVVLLSVKAYGLDGAVADMARAVGPQTLILPLLNGMRHLDVLITRFGEASVLGGACLLVTSLDAEGRIVQNAPIQTMRFGELDGTRSERVQRVANTFGGCGYESILSTTIRQDMWDKWIMLAALGAINCTMRGNIGEVACIPEGAEFSTTLLDEVLAVAKAFGGAPSSAYATQTRAMLTSPTSTQTSSMYRDLLAGRSVEADQIIGDLCARGAAHGIPTPLLDAAFANLKVYAGRLDRGF